MTTSRRMITGHRTHRHTRRSVVGAIGLTIGLALTGCVSFPAPESPPPTAAAVVPTPPGADFDVAREPAPNAQTCDTTTLRPGERPEVGRMPPGSTMAAIAGRGRLIVGLDTGSNLFSFRDPISGDIQGFDVDIARAIADGIFGDPTQVEFRVLASGERVEALRSGEVDIVVKTMSITCERLREVSFSAPYYMASQRIIALRNSGIDDADDLAGKRVCAARGVTSIGRLQSIQPRAEMVTAATWADCLVMLQQGQADAISTDDAILAGLAEQDPWLEVVGPSLGEEYYGVGIPPGQDDMVRFVNGVLEDFRTSGRWQETYERWLSILGPGYPPIPTYRS